MPNWCENYLVIKSEDKGYLQMLYDNLRKDEREFLQVLRPVPTGETSWFNWNGEGEVTKTLDGEWDWDWCVTHWGTKWDIQFHDASLDDDTLEVSFNTAWSPPVEALQYAAKKNKFAFSLMYYEGGMMFVGHATEDKDDCHSYTYEKHPENEVPDYLLYEFPWIEEDYEEHVAEKGDLEDA
tara:strand:- start:1623 stop:2165 length:543 start_codon:yes stop_codon:yes gene_type:complete